MEELSRQFIVNAYLDLGWAPKLGETITVEQQMRDLMIADQHRKLVYGQLTALSEGGFLKPVGDDSWEVIYLPVREEALKWVDRLAQQMPEFASEAELQKLAGPNLAGVLCGELDPLEVLFPQGSSRVMERFYREGADFPVINEQIRLALVSAVKDLPARRAIRVLEVGAGTGSLTGHILSVFPPERT